MVKAGGAGSTGIQLAKRVLADQVVMYVPPSPCSIYLRLTGQGTDWFDDVCRKYGFNGR